MAKNAIYWLCDEGKPYPLPTLSANCDTAMSTRSLGLAARKRTYGPFLLHHTLDDPVQKFTKKLTSPHVDDRDFPRIDGQNGITGLIRVDAGQTSVDPRHRTGSD